MRAFKYFLRRYNNKDFVPTLEAIQKMVQFYQFKGYHKLKLGGILPNLANICLHKSTTAKYHPFTESDKVFLDKVREDVLGGAPIVLTRKAVLDEAFIRDSTHW